MVAECDLDLGQSAPTSLDALKDATVKQRFAELGSEPVADTYAHADQRRIYDATACMRAGYEGGFLRKAAARLMLPGNPSGRINSGVLLAVVVVCEVVGRSRDGLGRGLAQPGRAPARLCIPVDQRGRVRVRPPGAGGARTRVPSAARRRRLRLSCRRDRRRTDDGARGCGRRPAASTAPRSVARTKSDCASPKTSPTRSGPRSRKHAASRRARVPSRCFKARRCRGSSISGRVRPRN